MADDVTLNAGSGGDVIAADDIGPGVKYQRVKVTMGADGVNDGDVSSTNPMPVELSDGVDTAGVATGGWLQTTDQYTDTDDDAVTGGAAAQRVIGLSYGHDGTNWVRLRTTPTHQGALEVNLSAVGGQSVATAQTDDDSIAGALIHHTVIGLGYGWDGTNWERNRVGQVDGNNSTTTPLGISGVFTGTATNVSAFAAISIIVTTDQPSGGNGLEMQFSPDGTNWDYSESISVGNAINIVFPVKAQWFRVVYTNGGSAQSIFRLESLLLVNAPVGTIEPEDGAIQPSRMRMADVSLLYGYDGSDWSRVRLEIEDDSIVAGSTQLTTVGLLYGYDGSNWERLVTNAGGELFVQISTFDKDTDDDAVAGGQSAIRTLNLLYGWDGTNWERLASDTNGRLLIAGQVSENNPVGTAIPVLIGGRGKDITPGVVDEGDVIHAWFDLYGRLHVQPPYNETDDGSVAGASNCDRNISLDYGWDGTNWLRPVVIVDDDDSIPGGTQTRYGVSLNYGWDGSNWERIQTNTFGHLFVTGDQPVDSPVGTNPLPVGARASDADPTAVSADGDGVHFWATRKGAVVIAGSNGAGATVELLTDSSGSPITKSSYEETDDDSVTAGGVKDCAVTLGYAYNGTNWSRLLKSTAGGGLLIEGPDGHDAAITGRPVVAGARANTNEPTAVAAGDATYLWADLFGRLVTLPGHPNPETPIRLNATASGQTQVIGGPGAGVSIYVCKGSIHNGDTSLIRAGLREAGGTNVWDADLAANGGGSTFDFGARGWKLTANTALQVDLSAAGDVWINITEYYLAP